jgi:hypothetical protein
MPGGSPLQRIAAEPARAIALGRSPSIARRLWTATLVGAPALLIGALAWPMLFTGDGFNGDWLLHLKLIWSQSQAIRANHHPSLFLNYSHSVLYPQYAFYGATVYAFAGSVSLALGDAPIETYVLTYLLGFASAYGGWYWMGRMAGLDRLRAQAPGLLFVTSAYYITLIYARGDWAEFLAVSLMPFLIASGLSVLRADRLHPWPALALVLSSVLFFGGHSLTILWGSTITAVAGALVLACVPEVRRWLTWRGVARLLALVGPAVLIDAWFLLPAIAYQAHTRIGSGYLAAKQTLEAFMVVVSASHLFTVERVGFHGLGRAFVLTLPVLAIAWISIGMAILLRGEPSRAWSRTLLICIGLTISITVLMTHAGLILALPRPYRMLQFSYRLESYVSMGISAAVLVILVLAKRAVHRYQRLSWALVPVLIVSVVGAIHQTGAYPSHGGSRVAAVSPALKPGPREEGLTDYTDARLRELVIPGRPAEVDFPAASLHEDRASQVVHLQPGQAFYSNIASGPEFVHVTGASIIGIDPEGNDILQVSPDAKEQAQGHGGEVVSVSPATGLPVLLGRILTLCGAIFLAGELAVLAARRLHLRGSRHPG